MERRRERCSAGGSASVPSMDQQHLCYLIKINPITVIDISGDKLFHQVGTASETCMLYIGTRAHQIIFTVLDLPAPFLLNQYFPVPFYSQHFFLNACFSFVFCAEIGQYNTRDKTKILIGKSPEISTISYNIVVLKTLRRLAARVLRDGFLSQRI